MSESKGIDWSIKRDMIPPTDTQTPMTRYKSTQPYANIRYGMDLT